MSCAPNVPRRASCNQRIAQVVGAICFLMCLWFTVLCFLSREPFPLWIPSVFVDFALAGAYLFLYSGTVSVDALGVIQRSMLGAFFMPWSSIENVWTGSGQLVLAGRGRRLALPGPDAWLGSGRGDVIAALLTHCENTGTIPKERLIAAFMISKGTKIVRHSQIL
ncbi:MAG: hypothetical protein JWM59_3536 [Verrucomicrobiales bacterium]|nr:hypothetical protein [Verrucomicrobiales bacterium]